MKSERKSEHRAYVYYFDWAEALLGMPDDIRLKIDDAIKRYALYGEEPNDPAVKYSIFALIRPTLDRNSTEYSERCERVRKARSDAGKKHRGNQYRKMEQMEQMEQMELDSDSDSDSDSITKEKSTNVDKKKTVHRFSPPSLSEVSDYIREMNYNVDAKQFINFYTSNGWKVGKNKMKDWRAAVQTWAYREKRNTPEAKEPVLKLSI